MERRNPFDHGTMRPRFVDVEPALAQRLGTIVERAWDTGSVSRIQRLDRGRPERNGNYRVETASGTYFLKDDDWRTPARQFTRRVIEQCAEQDVPVAKPIQEKHPEVNPGYLLAPFIEGTYFDGAREKLMTTAAALAHLHAVLRDETLERAHPAQKPAQTIHPRDTLQALLKLVRTRTPKDHFDTVVYDAIPYITACSNSVTPRALPEQLTHDDIHPHNLLYRRDVLAAFLDFENIARGQRARDVAFAMHRLGRTFGPLTEGKQDGDGSLRERARLFVDTYCAHTPLFSAEIQALPSLIKDQQLYIITLILDDKCNGKNLPVDLIEKHITILREADELVF